MLPDAVVLAAQVLSLIACICYYALRVLLSLPKVLFRNLFFKPAQPSSGESVTFYEGDVFHSRTKPKSNRFRYSVRVAVVSLDQPPNWFKGSKQARDHMSASEARRYAGTDGPVRLLTNPEAAGYIMNPISVYYCYRKSDNTLDKCIAEVTNTPWGERVTFVFDPHNEGNVDIKKSLHVSPFMDMTSTWQLEAPDPGQGLKLVVRVEHKEYGQFFYAELAGRKSPPPILGCRNEEAGLCTLLQYGFQPHRVAIWIYWQAIVLLWKGVPLYSPPQRAVLEAAAVGSQHPVNQLNGCPFTWRPAQSFPWDTWGTAAQPAMKMHKL